MAFTVGELAKLTGVTVRALHHYDEIGLVRPSQRTTAGYRLYADADVLRLHQVLLFRELGLPLEEIAAAIDEAGGQEELLRRHREVLVTKRARLDAMLAALDARLTAFEKGMTMKPEEVKSLFDGFDPSQYEEEARQRWGHTEAYKESTRRAKQYSKEDWDRYKREAQAIGERIVERMRAGVPPNDAVVQAAVEDHRLLIDRWFYPCSVAMHKNLGAMYVNDPRFTQNLDKLAPGYARYLSDAIAASPDQS
ncbi:MAG TPA: MerR family transcriptional regulator [Kofleriaceae bacterium]|nr:MerR family transcriptional regulator [Kofleriaceae bacterium]